ncbi:putative ubiquitin carboxyl-terminal hydrolase FAF-X [Homalodisca vitripennis]|nr:putative ubiquitin carboxyl-terminal hydrolase FAF-X [Homalodisca vitripennis]
MVELKEHRFDSVIEVVEEATIKVLNSITETNFQQAFGEWQTRQPECINVGKMQGDGSARWYKFDDGEVTECKMDDEEEMKTQCFGGDYMGEVFDHMLKRMSYRRQKRWWNAYMLFYTRLDVEESALVKSINQLSLCK